MTPTGGYQRLRAFTGDLGLDPFGNVFRYRSSVKVLNRNGATVSRLAYDVFLASR